MNVAYQGGIPSIYTRYSPRQRGGGFLSSLKRFLLPIAKTALPHLAGAVGDVVSGRDFKETLASRGRAAGAAAIREVGQQAADLIEPNVAPANKKYKRRATAPQKSFSAKRRKKSNWS